MSAGKTNVSDLREIVRRIRASESDRSAVGELGPSRNTGGKCRDWAQEQGCLEAEPLPDLRQIAFISSRRSYSCRCGGETSPRSAGRPGSIT